MTKPRQTEDSTFVEWDPDAGIAACHRKWAQSIVNTEWGLCYLHTAAKEIIEDRLRVATITLLA